MTLPRRSVLSVPGHVEKMHHKALGSKADVIMFDLEDSVPLDAKIEARKKIIASLDHCDLVPAVTSTLLSVGRKDQLEQKVTLYQDKEYGLHPEPFAPRRRDVRQRVFPARRLLRLLQSCAAPLGDYR